MPFRGDIPTHKAMRIVLSAAMVAVLALAICVEASVGQTPDLFDVPAWACSAAEEAAMLEACPGVFDTDLLAEIKSTGSDPMQLFKATPDVAAGVCKNEGCLSHITSMTCLPPDVMMISAICACSATIPDNCGTAMYAAISSSELLKETVLTGNANDADIAAFKEINAPFCAADQTCMTAIEEAGDACGAMELLTRSCCMYDLLGDDDTCLAAVSSLMSQSDVYGQIESANSTEELNALGIHTVADMMLNPLSAICEHKDCLPKMACMDEVGMNETNDIEELANMCSAMEDGCVRDTIDVCFNMDVGAFLQLSEGGGMFGGARRRLLQDYDMGLEALLSGDGADPNDPMVQMMIGMMKSMLGPVLEPLCSPCCIEAINTCDVSAVPEMAEMVDLPKSGICSLMNFTYPDKPCGEPNSMTVGALETGNSHAGAMAIFQPIILGLAALFAVILPRN